MGTERTAVAPRKKVQSPKSGCRACSQEFNQEAVQVLLDGHTTKSVGAHRYQPTLPLEARTTLPEWHSGRHHRSTRS
ncbi:hypothetical protein HG15A2_42000 [Adhaeretor mobilis]|uniref:Uncharacterized protein n=1 Tax=Adhaeretor mobilis TaxID=1930276 RepID=A0A517N1H3_9BACT|nr:hypothetical protein HG15A2_42000 [Adhaeretor mobilis]